jgi:hypothetical protein
VGATGRADQARITVFVDFPGLGDLGVWENRTGGSGDSDSTKHREGGMGPTLALGGPQTQENVTVARRQDNVRDLPLIPLLMAARGRAPMRVTEQPLDEYDNAFGAPLTWTGKLKQCNPADRNANSNDAAMLELEMDTEDTPR